MSRFIANFQYLTQDLEGVSHSNLAERACALGVRWVQYRSKKADMDEIALEASEVLVVCRKYDATCIFNDYVELARDLGADGVHLGKQDMPVDAARELLGPDAIIGGTANTENDVQSLSTTTVSYIGIGPFRNTSTKQNLAPVLGLQGIRQLVEVQNKLPVIAIGGVKPQDFASLKMAGCYGVAVSSSAHVIESNTNLLEFLSASNF